MGLPESGLVSASVATPPGWFVNALAIEPARSRFRVRGAEVELLTWGPEKAPGLMFVHGMGGHADWWRFIAPLFADTHRIAAISLSGMGRSDWRDGYDFETYVSEILRGAEQGGLLHDGQGPVLIAHSLGTIPALHAVSTSSQVFSGLVLVDPPMAYRPPKSARSETSSRAAAHTSLEEARRRYRTRPAAHCAPSYVMDFLAETSITADRGPTGDICNVRWKLDPALKASLTRQRPPSPRVEVACPLWVVRGEDSEVLTTSGKTWLSERLPKHARWLDIPASGHQVMLDQPLAFISALRAIVATIMSAPLGQLP